MRTSARRKYLCIAVAGGVLLTVSIFYTVLTYQPAAGADSPNVTDWMQGWGNVFGLFAGAAAAVAAGAVYLQGKDAAETAKDRWLHERKEAAEAARQAEDRWLKERTEAAEAARQAEDRWNEERAAAEERWHEELAEIRRTAAATEADLEDRRLERREAELKVPRGVFVQRVGPGMQGANLLGAVAAWVLNSNTEPIVQVSCLIKFKPDDLAFGASVPAIMGGATGELAWRSRDRPEPISLREAQVWDFDTPSELWSVTIHFTDGAGRTWRRVDNQEPTRIPYGQLP
jgi:hypothetical protein